MSLETPPEGESLRFGVQELWADGEWQTVYGWFPEVGRNPADDDGLTRARYAMRRVQEVRPNTAFRLVSRRVYLQEMEP